MLVNHSKLNSVMIKLTYTNNLTCENLTQIRSFARDASQQACHVTVRLQVGGGALYSYDTLWKAYLTLVQQRLIDRA